jgi:hypothetical protein
LLKPYGGVKGDETAPVKRLVALVNFCRHYPRGAGWSKMTP